MQMKCLQSIDMHAMGMLYQRVASMLFDIHTEVQCVIFEEIEFNVNRYTEEQGDGTALD